jgi:ferrochelatase
MEAVMTRRTEKNSYWLGFQSKVGPQKWTQPNTEDLVRRHLEYGIKNFLMIPIAFVTDHIETLYELGVELVEDLEEEGFEFESMEVMKGINEHPHYIKALAEEALNCLEHEIPADQISWEIENNRKAVTA